MTDNLNHAEREHSELSASSCHRWWHCGASIRLSRGIPRQDSPASLEGTAAHELAERCLGNGQDPIEYVGRRTIGGHEVTAEMAEDVDVYVAEVRRVWAKARSDARWLEQRVRLDALDPPAPMSGTVDAATFVIEEETIYDHDMKFGRRGRVEAVGNKQLRFYALGTLLAIRGNPRFAGVPVRRVVMTIVQPRSPAAGRDPIRSETITVEELEGWARELMVRARRAMEPDAPAVAGEWCKYCPAAGSCPAQASTALAVAQVEFDALVNGTASPAVVSPAELGAVLGKLDLLEQWIKDARRLAYAELAAGHDIPGWKLVESESRTTTWRDAGEAGGLIELAYGVDPWATREVISPAQARARIADAIHANNTIEWHAAGSGPRPTKKAAEAEARKALALLTYRSKSTALVPATDPRPASVGGGAEFPSISDCNTNEPE